MSSLCDACGVSPEMPVLEQKWGQDSGLTFVSVSFNV